MPALLFAVSIKATCVIGLCLQCKRCMKNEGLTGTMFAARMLPL